MLKEKLVSHRLLHLETISIDIIDNRKVNWLLFKLYRTLFVYLSIPILILSIILTFVNNAIFQYSSISYERIIVIIVLGILLPLSISLEEFFHAVIMILQGRYSDIKGVVFNLLKVKNFKLLCIGASVHIKGKITRNDILYLSIAGPLMAIIIGTIISIICIFVIVFFSMKLNLPVPISTTVKVFAMGLLLVPICSLVPISNGLITTDGYKIYQLVKIHKLSSKKIIQCSLSIIKECFNYLRW